MKRCPFLPWLLLLLCAALFSRGAERPPEKTPVGMAAATGTFLSATPVDWKTVLPPPPAARSLGELADLETVLQVQASRTPADLAWAKLIEKDDVYADYEDLFGPWFAEKNLPVLAGFLRQITADANQVNKSVKDLYPRRRPPFIEPIVQPCVTIPKTNSYPSGHSLRTHVWAAVLGDIFADRQVELYTRAHRVAWGRVIGGVHFPSDDVGGRIVAQAIVAELRKSPAYRAAIEQCRAEAAPFRLKKAA